MGMFKPEKNGSFEQKKSVKRMFVMMAGGTGLVGYRYGTVEHGRHVG